MRPRRRPGFALLAVLACAGTGAQGAAAAPAWLPPEVAARADAPRLGPSLAAPRLRAAAAVAQVAAGAGRLVVGARRYEDIDAVVRAARAQGRVVAVRRALSTVVVRVGDRRAAAAALRGRADVAFVEEPQPRRTLGDAPLDEIDARTGVSPMWWWHRVGAGPALALRPGAPFPVAVVDTGADVGHPDLAGRLAPGYDALNGGGTTVVDAVGHGTFIAGLIGAGGVGIRGVAGTTQVLPIRAGDKRGVDSAAAVDGILHAVRAGAKVINLSYGGPTSSLEERRALASALAQDVVIVASSGNSAEDGNPILYPAATLGGRRGGWSDGGVSVAASTQTGARASFSTFNDFVGIAAPGASDELPVDIGGGRIVDLGPCFGLLSTATLGTSEMADDPQNPCMPFAPPLAHAGGRYIYAQGTSFSAPIVAGAIALVRAERPGLRNDQAVRVVQATASRFPTWSAQLGFGELRMAEAVLRARTWDLTPPTLVASGRGDGTRATVTARATDRAAAGEQLAGGVILVVQRSVDGGRTWVSGPVLTSVEGRLEPIPPGGTLRLRVVACDAAGSCAGSELGPFAWRLRPPTATARALTGRTTSTARRLRFAVKDLDSTATRVAVTIYRGSRALARSRPQTVAIRKGVLERFVLRWDATRAQQRRATRWCVVATDPRGVGRAKACAAIRLR